MKGDSGTFISGMGPGGSFGELALLRPHALRTASCIAMTPVRCLSLCKDDLDRICVDHPRIGFKIHRRLAALLAERLEATSSDLAMLMKREVGSQDDISDVVDRINTGAAPSGD